MCVDGAFCQSMPEEMVDRGMSFGPKHVAIEQFENLANAVCPAVKHVKAMKHRDELNAEGRTKSLETVKIKLAESQEQVGAEITKLLARGETSHA